MNRRTFGRGRLLATLGGIATLVGCFLPWGRTGGAGLPPLTTSGFDGAGIVVFIAAVVVLALITLPYAAGDEPIDVDRPLFFALALLLGIGGLVVRVAQLVDQGVLGLLDRSPGLWLAAIGLGLVVLGVSRLAQERRAV